MHRRARPSASRQVQPIVRGRKWVWRLFVAMEGSWVSGGDRMRRVSGPQWVDEPRPGTDGFPAVPWRQHPAGFRLRVFNAVLYIAGLSLLILGAVGALLWGPLLWCMAAGLVAITVALATRGGRI